MPTGRSLRRALASAVLSAPLLLAVPPCAAHGQQPRFSGYYLNIGAGVAESRWNDRAALNFQRIRLMSRPRIGPVTVELAYEHTLFLRSDAEPSGAIAGGTPVDALEWLALDWTVRRTDQMEWRHRFDRLNLAAAIGPLRVQVGRQAVSWATTLFLTPADPFTPFDPSDSFREYRGGIDALRVRVFPGPFSEVDLVVRPVRSATDTTLTGLLRGSITLGDWDLSGWGGFLHDAPAGAFGATTTVGRTAVRSEVSIRQDTGGAAVLRAAVGVDRRFLVRERALVVAIEYQRDGLGATSSDEFQNVLESAAFRRGELQTLARNMIAGNLSFEVQPLVGTQLLGTWNLQDGSGILGPSVSVSVSGEAAAYVGVYTSVGPDDIGPTGLPKTEYGATPTSVYAAFSIFF